MIWAVEWQQTEFERIAAALPDADVEVHGSAVRPGTTDGWSDLDLRVATDSPVPCTALVADAGLWAYEDVREPGTESCRMVLGDGRRIDVSISGTGRIAGLEPEPDKDVRFVAAMAAAKLGRGDRLIGGHLLLGVLRSCLVVAMELRDRDLGTTVHRTGSERDRHADLIVGVAALPLAITPRPNAVERAAEVYARLRSEQDPEHAQDWDPLTRLIDRGLESNG